MDKERGIFSYQTFENEKDSDTTLEQNGAIERSTKSTKGAKKQTSKGKKTLVFLFGTRSRLDQIFIRQYRFSILSIQIFVCLFW